MLLTLSSVCIHEGVVAGSGTVKSLFRIVGGVMKLASSTCGWVSCSVTNISSEVCM